MQVRSIHFSCFMARRKSINSGNLQSFLFHSRYFVSLTSLLQILHTLLCTYLINNIFNSAYQMVFCFENCSNLLREKIVLNIKIFMKQNPFLTLYWRMERRFLRSITSEQLKCQLQQIIGMQKPTRTSQKKLVLCKFKSMQIEHHISEDGYMFNILCLFLHFSDC